jgi:hypothetical protein
MVSRNWANGRNRLAIITQLPNYPITQLPNYPITQLPNYPITQLPNYPITQLLNYPITQLPNYSITAVFYNPRRLPTPQFPKVTGTVAELLFEGFTEGGVAVVSGGQGNFGDVYGAHAQLPARPFQSDATDVGGDVFALLGGEDAVEMGNGETGNGR